MASEKDLNSPDSGSAAIAPAEAVTVVEAAEAKPRWKRWLGYTFFSIGMGAFVANTVYTMLNFNTLPACGSQRSRTTLSDLNIANQVNASDYNFIKEVSRSDEEVLCVANLALRDGSTLEYDYRLYTIGPVMHVTIMTTRGTIGNAKRTLPLAY
ncbi:MAG: hypothetical protein QOH67_368 [Hyphomicrobiales bacterium]|nr:hypothetical protein [Hyphomicrobiales bacterium]